MDRCMQCGISLKNRRHWGFGDDGFMRHVCPRRGKDGDDYGDRLDAGFRMLEGGDMLLEAFDEEDDE